MIGPRLVLPLAVLHGASLAAAAEPLAPAAADGANGAVDADADSDPEPMPAASDTLAGHLALEVGPLFAVPFAQLDERTASKEAAGIGVGLGGKVGVGVSRGLSLGGFAEYTAFGHPSGCDRCEANAFAFGPFVRYHLVQGVRFDPQVALGVGYRKVNATTREQTYRYAGIDWLRLEFGGAWYALSQVGFGPYAELSLGTFTKRPENRDPSVYGCFSLGLRLFIDARGR